MDEEGISFTVKNLPTLNEYINAERSNRFAAHSIKKKATEKVCIAVLEKTHGNTTYDKIFLRIDYHEPTKRKDKDNIAFQKKFILDGLQKAGLIKNDGWNTIVGWSERFYIAKGEDPGVVVVVVKVE